MEEKKSIYFQRPNQKKVKTKTSSSDPDSEEESFSDVFKIKKPSHKTTDISRTVISTGQVNVKHLKSQSRASESNSSDEKPNEENSDENHENIIQCPICLNKIHDKTNVWKVNHFKHCATKHKVPTQKLMEALRIQMIQFEEREKLGLPNVRTEKQTASRRNNSGNTLMKQMNSKDPNIQLAMALSASYQEAQEAALMKETSTLFEAGLETEAIECCKTLETLPVCQPNPPKSCRDKKLKAMTIPVLLTRSKEERERLISEKVENVVFLQEKFLLPPFPAEPYQLKSRTLKKVAIPKAQLWELSQVENNEESAHYTKTYLRCRSSEKIETSRENTGSITSIEKQYCEVEENNLQELEMLFESIKVKSNSKPCLKTSSVSTISSRSSSLNTKDHTSEKKDKDYSSLNDHERRQINDLRILSKNLGLMIGKRTFSDINIFTKEETAIPCHKIILLSRMPSLLKDIIKEENAGRRNEMLIWNMENNLCLIVLKYLYSGMLDHNAINKLDISQLNELKQFCDTYRIRVFSNVIENIEARRSDNKKSEHFNDLPPEQNTGDSHRPKSLDKWLDNLKNRDPTIWRNNFRKRFNKIENKLQLDCSTTNDLDTEKKYTNSESSAYKNIDIENTDEKINQIESTKLNQQDEQNTNEKCNETVSVISQSDDISSIEDDSKRKLESIENNDPNVFCIEGKTKERIYYFDSDIYDQETYNSVKTSDTDQVGNSDTEVRQSHRSLNSVYDKNMLSHSLEDINTQHTEQEEYSSPRKMITMAQQTLNVSPELFSNSDEDHDENVLNLQSSKANTQINLHKLINLMDKDISACPRDQVADDIKKRKRSPSRRSLENLKRSKQTSSEHESSPRCPNLNTKVNEIYLHRQTVTQKTSKHSKIDDLISDLSTKTNLSIPCVAGYSKSRNAARNLAIDFDKIEVDTSVPPQSPKTLNLTVENLMLFNEINERSNDSLFERETLPNSNLVSSPKKSSHGSSLYFETYMSKYKNFSRRKSIPTIKEKTTEDTHKSNSYVMKRKKSSTPDFLKAKFYDSNFIEIKSSSEESIKCYPTKALSRQYQLSQKMKKITPPKHKKFHSQPRKKSVTPKSIRSQTQKRFHPQHSKQDAKLFPSDSSDDELSKIIKRKSEQTRDLCFEKISPIPRLNISNSSCQKLESETYPKSRTLNNATYKDSIFSVENTGLKYSSSNKTHGNQEISRDQNGDSISSASDSKVSIASNSMLVSKRSRSKYSERYLHQCKSLKINKSQKIASHHSSNACSSSPNDTDEHSSVVDIPSLSPPKDMAQYCVKNISEDTQKGVKNITPIPASPSNEIDPSPPVFSPPRYIWDDPDYNDYILPPIEDPTLSDCPADNIEQKRNKEKIVLDKTTKDDMLSSSEIEREDSVRSITEKLSTYSQSFQNSQFMKKYEEYFRIQSKDQSKIYTEKSSKKINPSIPIKGCSSLHNIPLSPNVIIHKADVTSDSSSTVSPRKQTSKHHQQPIDSHDVDCEYFKRKVDADSRTQKFLSTSHKKFKFTSELTQYAKQTSHENNLIKTSVLKLKDSKKYANISSSDSKSSDFTKNDTKKIVSNSRSTDNRSETVPFMKIVSSNVPSNSEHQSTTTSDGDSANQTLTNVYKDKYINFSDEIKPCKKIAENIASSQSKITSISNLNSHPKLCPKFHLGIKNAYDGNDDNMKYPKKSIPKESRCSDISSESNSSSNKNMREYPWNLPTKAKTKFELSRPNIPTRACVLSSSPIYEPTFPHCRSSTSYMNQSQPSTSNIQQSQPSPSYMQQSQPLPNYIQQSQPSTSYKQQSPKPSTTLTHYSDKREAGRNSVRKSLNFDHLLEESLHLNESYVNRLEANHGAGAVRTPVATKTKKSLNNTSTVTPLADYSAMETPLLKKELTKFGIKPSLGKGKAKLMLRYIYNQTHPYVDSEPENPPPKKRKSVKVNTTDNPESSKYAVRRLEKIPKKNAIKDKNVRISREKTERNVDALRSDESKSSDEDLSSEISIGSPIDSQQVYEESILFEQNLGCSEDNNVEVTPLFFSEVDGILRSEENYRKILSYEPLWLEHLHKELKQRGVRSNLKQLMDYLDEKCITFRTTRKNSSVKVGAKSKGRKPVQSQALETRPAKPVRKLRHQSQTVSTSRGAKRD